MYPLSKILTFIFVFAAFRVEAQLAVHDAPAEVTKQAQHLENLTKWADSLSKMDAQIQQGVEQINKLKDIQKFIGDPTAANLPGNSLGAIGSMYRSTSSIYRNVNGVAQMATSTIQGGTGNLGNMYSMDDALWYLEKEGVKFDNDRYRRYQAADASASAADKMNEESIKELNSLNDELTSLQEKLNTATTQAEIEKLNGLISSVQSKVASIEARRRATMDTQMLIHLQNENDEAQRKAKIADATGAGLGSASAAMQPSNGKRDLSAIAGR